MQHGLNGSSIPVEIEEINDLSHKKHSPVKKISSAKKFTFVLFENGTLYSFGQNDGGVLATRANPLIRTDDNLFDLTKVNDQFYHGQKVEDFAISGNSIMILTDAGNLYYSGMHCKWRPEPFPVGGNVKKIFATYDSVGYIDQNNTVRYINDQIIDDSDVNNGVFTVEDPNFKGSVLEIGGTYTLRYALIQK